MIPLPPSFLLSLPSSPLARRLYCSVCRDGDEPAEKRSQAGRFENSSHQSSVGRPLRQVCVCVCVFFAFARRVSECPISVVVFIVIVSSTSFNHVVVVLCFYSSFFLSFKNSFRARLNASNPITHTPSSLLLACSILCSSIVSLSFCYCRSWSQEEEREKPTHLNNNSE